MEGGPGTPLPCYTPNHCAAAYIASLFSFSYFRIVSHSLSRTSAVLNVNVILSLLSLLILYVILSLLTILSFPTSVAL